MVELAVVAAVAAHAARTTPGVLRLEPGARGLVSSVLRASRPTNAALARSDGVRVRRNSLGALSVHVDVAISAEPAAAVTGQAVQQRVGRLVREQTGQRVDEITVLILDIEPGWR
ncbi:Asp23/Gls24 family envelope stress response protein [Nocardia sp. NPDC057668]|uniref:Asp23/Gls24 family envelope stress response protein n=1 Tax=Nocardia sp. NPDC057668 TaxID=3346202 RepID=UPI00366B59A6